MRKVGGAPNVSPYLLGGRGANADGTLVQLGQQAN